MAKDNYLGKRGPAMYTPGGPIPDEAYRRLIEWAKIQINHDQDVESAHGVKFEPPLPISNEMVAEKSMDMPCEIYNDNGEEDLILRNWILWLNFDAAVYQQYWFGEIGEKYIRVPPNEWVMLPHRFYFGYLKSGRPPKIVGNLGSQKGKGIKEVIQ